ncbi:hypothetical protein IV203_035951 [Nitzschia inconspicua]|uniref:Uncharacterized protein n=1 Tax=Nitzschia inconspicua TaxID=303405 RepID=A0A9K3PV42_9STRA|nr:hypothetical protein IV203_035951 [Nitzschia inconspicua]
MMKLFLICLLFIGSAMASALLVTLAEPNVTTIIEASTSSPHLRARVLSSATVTTPDCSAIRLAPYPAELQLFYDYSVEFKRGRAVSLTDLERAIANAVAVKLNTCDASGRPLFKVRTDVPHRFSDSICTAKVTETNGCILIKGQTNILLDNESNLVRAKAYDAIENGLMDPKLLEGYTDSVVQTSFLSRGKALLVEAGQDNGGSNYMSPITATIAVAAASVSFVVASVLCYGFMKRDTRNHPEPSIRHKGRSLKTSTRTVVSDSIGGRARRHFVRLEDLSASPASYMTASLTPMSAGFDYGNEETEIQGYDENDNPAIAWSVSDITSDSASLRSGVSRSPSMLERIEEEEEEREKESDNEGEHDCVTNGVQNEFRSGTSQDYRKVEDYDCKSLRRHEMLDVSDLDACFTIAPVPRDVQSTASTITDGRKDAVEEVIVNDTQMDGSSDQIDDAADGSSDEIDDDATELDGSLDDIVDDATESDGSSDQIVDDAAALSESDFSESSLLVQADVTDSTFETKQTLHEVKPGTRDPGELKLELSHSTSDMIQFLSCKENSTLQVTDAEDEQISDVLQFDDLAVDSNREDLPVIPEMALSLNQEETLTQIAVEPTSMASSDDKRPGIDCRMDDNVEDSIEEWVSEL